MKPTLHLSPGERNILTQILHRRGISINDLVQRWANFVMQVEKGYEDSIYEYTNDLSIRDVYEEILLNVPENLRNKLAEAMRLWDERFNAATQKVKRPLVPGVSYESAPWWFRIPKKLSSELKADLESEGIIERKDYG